MRIESIENEIRWRNEQIADYYKIIPEDALVLYHKQQITSAEELLVESYRDYIQKLYRAKQELDLLEDELYIENLKQMIANLESLINSATKDLKGKPKHKVDKSTKLIRAWRKEQYEYKKELVVLEKK